MQVKASCQMGVGITWKAELDKKGKAFEGKQAAFTIEVCGLVSNSLTMAWNWKVWRSQPKIFGTKKLVGPKRGLGLHNWVCRGLCRFVVYFKTPSQRRETAKFCLHNQKSLAQKTALAHMKCWAWLKGKDFQRKTTCRCWAKTVSLPFAPRMARLDGDEWWCTSLRWCLSVHCSCSWLG